MAKPKIVFVQTKSTDVASLASMLGGIKQMEYQFVILPSDSKLLSKRELREMIDRMPD